MDGVLWRSSRPLGDLPGIFREIEARGWKVVLASNNATRSVEQYVDRLSSFGVNLRADQVINSASATAAYLSARFPKESGVHIVGEEGLRLTLEAEGFQIRDADVVAVVCALDREFTYDKLNRASALIRSGAAFIATNPDPTFPDTTGVIPGAGSLVAAVQAASETEPVVVGKPSPEMFRQALERMETLPEETLVVGDRLETDIAGGQNLGCRTALVLSGVTTEKQAHSWKPAPDLIAPDLTRLLEALA
jgi:4-nitrophenyl phosphatase